MASHFKELIAWQKAMDLAAAVYRFTLTLPTSERFGLIQQLQRAAVSVVSNIAEGHERRSRAEYRRFLSISAGSLAELETQLLLSVNLELTTQGSADDALGRTREVGRIIRGIERGLRRSSEP